MIRGTPTRRSVIGYRPDVYHPLMPFPGLLGGWVGLRAIGRRTFDPMLDKVSASPSPSGISPEYAEAPTQAMCQGGGD